ncbi:ribosomal-protein-alanine N-acetyltransferase [Mumia flava]|uniref:[Ribosomal protein bS18]-alanine N-acetyltransferase n=1 Tax=Mumia flava TaxID=1348852 RepID=A0A0B2BT16_9ACTN|nr:ribosomal protein S18-alanine N-acetyltransferase [Mumia flava]PJJ58395.1 ribosomal-protein-alanine N-acetyltransferase [Mumia flava]
MIARASAEHAETITEIEQACFGADAWSAPQVTDEIGRPTRTVLVATVDGDVVGYASVLVVAGTAELVRIAVVPARRRRGVATRLMDAVLQVAHDAGADEVLLEAAADNDAALALYGRHGFTRTTVRRGYYHGGKDAVMMRHRTVPERTV